VKNPTKICYKCQEKKSANEFYKRAQLIDGLSTYCKDCWKAINEERKEILYAQQAEYRAQNSDKRNKAFKKYWKKNREEILANRRKRYQEKKEAAEAARKPKKP
jgi:hypothetical protein